MYEAYKEFYYNKIYQLPLLVYAESSNKYVELVNSKDAKNFGDIEVINDVKEICNLCTFHLNNERKTETFCHKISRKKDVICVCGTVCFTVGVILLPLVILTFGMKILKKFGKIFKFSPKLFLFEFSKKFL